MKKIAIIGGGVAGNAILHHLIRHHRFSSGYRVDVFDSEERMGRGQPYMSDSEFLLLNLPSEEMTLSRDPYGFINWLKDNRHPVFSYHSRNQFGNYMASRLNHITRQYPNIRLVNSEVTDIIYEEGAGYTLKSEKGAGTYDIIFMTTGQMSYNDPYELEGTANYIQDPYPVSRRLKDVGGEVGVIGTGLSAIDCVRYLILERSLDKVYLFSRNGDMPSVRGEKHRLNITYFTEEAVDALIKDDLIGLDDIIGLFKREMAVHNIEESLFYRHTGNTLEDLKYDIGHKAEVGKLQYLIMAVNPLFSRVFSFFTNSDKKRFMKEIHPLIDKNHSPMPFKVAERLVEWADQGKMIIVDGIEAVEAEGEFTVITKHGNYHLDYLINATGPNADITNESAPLIRNLTDRMLLAPGALGGVIVDKAHRIISPKYGTLPGMYAIGHLTFSSDYMANTVSILLQNTRILVDDMFEAIKSP